MADSKNTLTATDTNFESDVLKADELALVDFWAEWCGPCRMLGPTIDQIADEYRGKLKVYKMNVDENPNTPSRFHVRGIPTVLVVQEGASSSTSWSATIRRTSSSRAIQRYIG